MYDLEERTLAFAKRVFAFIHRLPKTITNIKACDQLARSSGSIGANYIEANESLGKKDFLMHVKISRKESKESRFWLQLVICKPEDEAEQLRLIQESTELMKIFGSIVQKSS
ncbi:MAG: four helix bundle protein [Bacteroidota bacterium]